MNALGCALALALMSANAQTIRIPVGSQSEAFALPTLGQSQTSVLERFGLPLKEHPPVGQPPISRWEYPNFSVYFEYQHVLKSVVHPPQRGTQ